MLNRSKDECKSLPKIYNQKRVSTAFQKRDNSIEIPSNKLLANNRQLKRTLSAANTFKAVRYETTGIIYAKKAEELEKQNKLLDEQIKRAEHQIEQMRKTAAKTARNDEISRVQRNTIFVTQTSLGVGDSKVSYRKNLNLSDEKALSNEIKITDNKIQILRKKVDEYNEKNEKIRKQIEAIRKQIVTFKNLCKAVQNSLETANKQFIENSQLSKKLDEELAAKNSLMHKIKIANQHKKAQTIKQYDNILKQLQKELSEDKNSQRLTQGDPGTVYITQFANKEVNSKTKSAKFHLTSTPNRTKTNFNNQITAIKEKLQKYQKQFNTLKDQAGTSSTEEAVKQFYEKYEENFGYYKYINELHNSLEEKQRENQQMLKKKEELLQEIGNTVSDTKYNEILQIRNEIQNIQMQKMKYTTKTHQFEQMKKEMIGLIKQFYSRVNMKCQTNFDNLSEQTISNFLGQIKERCTELSLRFSQRNDQINYDYGDIDIGDLLQIVKKENQESNDPRNEKIMTRQDFLKTKDLLIKKKQTPRKRFSKK